MIVETLKSLCRKDLEKLRGEIQAYKDESKIWYIEKNIANSAGNLCLHLIGNLNTYIGAELGNTGYVRDRDAEFSLKNIPRTELIQKINETIVVVEETLNKLHEEKLDEEYPMETSKGKITISAFLLHIATHLTYHIGQINYHRRLLDND
ncbi:DinB family protein [Chitinophagaceae bacterium LWZ2-11]